MNRLIIIGNGFDLAHGKKTDYKSFIFWYIKKCMLLAYHDRKNSYEDNLIKVTVELPNFNFKDYGNNKITDIKSYIEYFFPNNFQELLYHEMINLGSNTTAKNLFKTYILSPLLQKLLSNCIDKNWVDIENEYYSFLVDFAKMARKPGSSQNLFLVDLENLNSDLERLIKELENYLKDLHNEVIIYKYVNILNPSDKSINYTYILNFNYTDTPEQYLPLKEPNLKNNQMIVEHNYIHGKIDDKVNSLIFGFGDDLDKEYVNIEELNINEFFTYIKSFKYFNVPNYQNLAKFIVQDEYEIYLLGHSCGLSDRTMLNMIFENKNCLKIKIFYHIDNEGNNNYTDLTHNISRHFKDKAAMRLKIAPFTESQPMPQFNDKVDN